MEDRIVIHYPDGKMLFGHVKITDTEMVFSEQDISGNISTMTTVFNSTAPNTFIRTEKRVRFDEIVVAKRKRYRLNFNAFYVTLKDGDTYVVIFDHPKRMIKYLESVLSKATKVSISDESAKV